MFEEKDLEEPKNRRWIWKEIKSRLGFKRKRASQRRQRVRSNIGGVDATVSDWKMEALTES